METGKYLIFVIVIVLSGILTYFVRKFAIKKSVIDIPNQRSSHSMPTPRLGGIPIVILWYFSLIYLLISNNIEKRLFLTFLIGGLPLAIIGIIDDFVNVKPVLRLMVQSFSAATVIYFLGFNFIAQISPSIYLLLIGNILLFLFITWFINLYNFLDGIDAYASQEAVLVLFGLFLFTQDFILLLLIGSVLGFLFWNWPRAKIFMGDIGSTQLGFILITFGIYYSKNNDFHFINWLLLTSLFWFDASVTLIRRILNKEHISKAHKKHAYQRINQYGFSHLKIVIIAIVINVFLICIVYLSMNYFEKPITLFLFVLIFLSVLMKIIDNRKPFPKDRK